LSNIDKSLNEKKEKRKRKRNLLGSVISINFLIVNGSVVNLLNTF